MGNNKYTVIPLGFPILYTVKAGHPLTKQSIISVGAPFLRLAPLDFRTGSWCEYTYRGWKPLLQILNCPDKSGNDKGRDYVNDDDRP